MKSQFIFITAFLSFSFGFSQIGLKDDAVYIDSLDNIGNEKNFKYIRVVKDFNENKALYDIEFYNRYGKIVKQGKTSNKLDIILEGTCVSFYENGKRKKIETFTGNRKNGKQYEWYENGNIKLESEVEIGTKMNNSITRIINYWNENNEQKVTNGEGEYEEIEVSETKNGRLEILLTAKGLIKDFLKEGTWIGECKSPRLYFTEKYNHGKFISGTSIDSLKVERTYTEIETSPIPKKGRESFYAYIYNNYKKPLINGLEGSLHLSFVIEKDGTINDIKILKHIGFGTGEEAVRLLIEYGPWTPGKLRGIPARTTRYLPLNMFQPFFKKEK